jgi:hypothetical protein
MPTLPKLLAGLASRGITVDLHDGRLSLDGPVSALADPIVRVAVWWHADELAIVAGAGPDYVVGECDVCAQWRLVPAGAAGRCHSHSKAVIGEAKRRRP